MFDAVLGRGRPGRLAVILLAAGLLLAAGRAEAHGGIVRSEPAANASLEAAPARVSIWFTEPVEPGLSRIQVLDAAGQGVDGGDGQVEPAEPTRLSVGLPSLPDGAYTVAWRNVSAVDGHALEGVFRFGVGVAPPAAGPEQPAGPLFTSPFEPLARWAVLAGILAIIGGLTFELAVSEPACAAEHPRLRRRLANRSLNLVWLAMLLFFLGSLGQLWLQTANAYGLTAAEALGRPLLETVSATGWGRLWAWRMGLFLLLLAVLPLSPQLNAGRGWGASWERQREALGILVGAGILLTLTLVSHAAAVPELRAAAVANDFLHLLASSVWAGGLLHFALATPLVLGSLAGGERRALLARLTPSFSRLAIVSVASLILTGLFATYVQVTTLAALNTPYGRTLLAKLALVAVLLALGAGNLLIVSPRLDRRDGAGGRLRDTVRAEAGLVLVVLLLAAALSAIPPARQTLRPAPAAAGPFEASDEGTTVALTVEPAEAGTNSVTAVLSDRRGEPIADASGVNLTLRYLDGELPPLQAEGHADAAGVYTFHGLALSVAGRWQAEVRVIQPDAFDAETRFNFEVGPAGAPA
ncbi:MAG: copper resistance protein CopC, partial [Candidatus Promineifilaceae bacterium]